MKTMLFVRGWKGTVDGLVTGQSSFEGFLCCAGFRPSTVLLGVFSEKPLMHQLRLGPSFLSLLVA